MKQRTISDQNLVKHFNNASHLDGAHGFSKKNFPQLRDEVTFANDAVTFVENVPARVGHKNYKNNYFLMSYNLFTFLGIPKNKTDPVPVSDFNPRRAYDSAKVKHALILNSGRRTPFIVVVDEKLIEDRFGDNYIRPKPSLE